MNEIQYSGICEACDRVLLSPESTVGRTAIAWLHVVREHPVILANYVDLIGHTYRRKYLGRRGLRALRNWVECLRDLGQAFLSDGSPWFASNELPQRVDVLFVSHLPSESSVLQSDDFYFGRVPNDLAANGLSTVIALINHSTESGASLAVKLSALSVPRVIFSRLLSISDEASLCRCLVNEAVKLAARAKSEEVGLFKRVLERASQEALSGRSRGTLRLGEQIGRLVARLRPRVVVVTHEGHAWERVAFAVARKAIPNVRCVGYQHAVLFRLQRAIRRNLAPEYNPDLILTAGKVALEQLASAPGLRGTPIALLGSSRGFMTSATEVEPEREAENPHPSVGTTCLVLPEGFESECRVLFDVTLRCAEECPHIRFIWRLHPMMTFSALEAKDARFKKLPRNIERSRASLKEDMSRCRWALYRGTTAIIQAVGAGLRPIYCEIPGELTIDPLFELAEWRDKISTHGELQELINTHSDAGVDASSANDARVRRYCQNVFLPFNYNQLLDVVLKA